MKRLLKWACVAALVLWVARAYVLPYCIQTPLERESASPVVDGLQLRVKRLDRESETLRMTFVHARVGKQGDYFGPNLGVQFLHPWSFIGVEFWDADGKKLGETRECMLSVPQDFRRGSVPPPRGGWLSKDVVMRLVGCSPAEVWTDTASLEIPAGARYVSLSCGDHRRTNRVRIPE